MKPHGGNVTVKLNLLEIHKMETNVRGKSGSGSRTNSSWGRNSMQMNQPGSMTNMPAGYKGCCNSFARKIQSFQALVAQTKGAAKFSRPSPTQLNSFANWINKGAIIQTVSSAQVARWAKSTSKNYSTKSPSPTSCKTVLCAKFGKNTIKAVCRTKSGSFMVATSPTVSGRTFNFPK